MSSSFGSDAVWPELQYSAWRETAQTLQLWTQIIGKIRLAYTPWVNHGWQVPLYVTARGLSTSGIPIGTEILEIEFDFMAHRLVCRTSRGGEGAVVLESKPVSAFYKEVFVLLECLGFNLAIHGKPNEVVDPIPFADDHVHQTYDAHAAHRFWRVLVQADRVLKLFRTSFVGKVSPVHFFWGAFDLAVTRFSGRVAPKHPGAAGLPPQVLHDAYSHEVSSAGFWPGSDAFPHAAFYSYAYPAPEGFGGASVPKESWYEERLSEYVLPYEAVRKAKDPEVLIQEFLASTYADAAALGKWDRNALECAVGRPGIPKAC